MLNKIILNGLCALMALSSSVTQADSYEEALFIDPLNPAAQATVEQNNTALKHSLNPPLPNLGALIRPDERTQRVLPNQFTPINISNKDVNHLRCLDGSITDRTFSEEKPLIYKPGTGNNTSDAYLKLKAQLKGDGTQLYYTEPVELYVVCAGDIYSMQLIPGAPYSQRIVLTKGITKDLNANRNLYRNMTLEEAAMDLIDKVQFENDRLPGTFSKKTPPDEEWMAQQGSAIKVRLIQKIKPEGVGLQVREYLVWSPIDTKLHEFQFVKNPIAPNMLAVRLETLNIKKEQTVRLFVVERMWK